jgi:hypothetical protein
VNRSDTSNPERGKTLVLVLTLINTVLVASISALQVDANIHANQANRDSQYYAILVSSNLVQTGYRSDYDLNTYSQYLTNTQESLVAEFSAMQRQAANDQQGSDALTLAAQIYQARAEQARKLSILMSDPAYAPPSDQDPPNQTAYLNDLASYSWELVQKQNTASDAYHLWNNKSDSYVGILTVLAVAFFILGVAQMTQPRLRLFFSTFAIGVIGIGVLWTLIIVLHF